MTFELNKTPFVLSLSKYRLLASSFDRLRTNGNGVKLKEE
jgi:hypothetical protein